MPILKGYHGEDSSPEILLQHSREIGFPVMLKASLGGGGKGMRIVRNEEEFMDQLDAAKREAKKNHANEDRLKIPRSKSMDRRFSVMSNEI